MVWKPWKRGVCWFALAFGRKASAEFNLQRVGKEKSEDLQYITFGHSGKLSKAFFLTALAQELNLVKALALGNTQLQCSEDL